MDRYAIRDNSRYGYIRDNSRYGYIRDNSRYGYIRDNSRYGYIRDNSRYGYIRDNSRYGYIRDNSRYGYIRDNSRYGYIRDNSRYGYIRDNSRYGYIRDKRRVIKHLTSSCVHRPLSGRYHHKYTVKDLVTAFYISSNTHTYVCHPCPVLFSYLQGTHRENREIGHKKIPVRENTRILEILLKHREFCLNSGKTQGILVAQVINVLIPKVRILR